MKHDMTTGISTPGNHIIGNILSNNMALLPFAINPFVRFGPILHHFLLDHRPSSHLKFPPSHPNASSMYSRIMSFPCPTGILPLATIIGQHTKLDLSLAILTQHQCPPSPHSKTLVFVFLNPLLLTFGMFLNGVVIRLLFRGVLLLLVHVTSYLYLDVLLP